MKTTSFKSGVSLAVRIPKEFRFDAKSTPIGPLDTLIAGHALEHELTLVTGNIREFSRVEDLPLENWDET